MKKTFSVNYQKLIKKPSHSSPKSKYDYLIKNIYDDCIVKNPLILTSIQKKRIWEVLFTTNYCWSLITLISTRRLISLPRSVSLLSIGRVCP